MPNKILCYTFKTSKQLKDAYLPFFINGAILIPTTEDYELNSEICLKLDFPNDKKVHKFVGKVIWVTPQTNHDIQHTVGIQFNKKEDGEIIRKEIRVSDLKLKTKDSSLPSG